jgi:hypothetical protein
LEGSEQVFYAEIILSEGWDCAEKVAVSKLPLKDIFGGNGVANKLWVFDDIRNSSPVNFDSVEHLTDWFLAGSKILISVLLCFEGPVFFLEFFVLGFFDFAKKKLIIDLLQWGYLFLLVEQGYLWFGVNELFEFRAGIRVQEVTLLISEFGFAQWVQWEVLLGNFFICFESVLILFGFGGEKIGTKHEKYNKLQRILQKFIKL